MECISHFDIIAKKKKKDGGRGEGGETVLKWREGQMHGSVRKTGKCVVE